MRTRMAVPAWLAALCVGQFVAAWWLGGAGAVPVELATGALWLRDPWGPALLSATFVHESLGHLVNNLILGGFVSVVVLAWFGVWRWTVLWTLSGLGGSVASALAHPDAPLIGMGASTAIWGLMGGCLGLWARLRRARPAGAPASDDEAAMGGVLLFTLLPNLLYALFPTGGRAGHLGGGAAGLVLVGLGWVLPSEKDEADSAALRAMGVVCALLCVGSVGAAWVRNEPWTLRSPAPFETVELAPGVTASLPSRLALRSRATDADGCVLRRFGARPFDWLRVRTRVQSIAAPLPDDEAEGWLLGHDDPPRDDLTWSGPPELIRVGGQPALRRLGVFADHDRLVRHVLLKGARLVELDIELLPETSGEWAEVAAPIAASVRWDE